MTRLMGDAIHDDVSQLAAVPGLQLVAGYVTGSVDIVWTAADWAQFPGLPHVTIDQGFTGSPVADAIVRDVETGAWTPQNAVTGQPWTAARPTIYCNMSTLPAVLAAGWRGDLWLAMPGHTGTPPAIPGCNVVAIQDTFTASYDLSTVYDDTWPEPEAIPVTSYTIDGIPGFWQGTLTITPNADGTIVAVGTGTDGNTYTTRRTDQTTWQPTARA